MTFTKVLIANRGEIACRVIDTARKMRLGTVAVFSDADRDARHVALADEAVWIGGAAPADSYLKGTAIIEAALATGAGAIHPGYGFLSENPDFVEAVEAAGLIFVGPSATAIRAMGLKDAAKALMEAAGVPVVPGYLGADQEPGRLEVEAADIGYPVLIKAVAGGGGKGMRKVLRPEDFIDALESANAEARTAFGNDAVLIEKYVEKPRHIEVQVFGDGTRAVHLFERDCSLQRRHQKVIEEAPSPINSHELRTAMGECALKIAKAVDYVGAGTVEFLVSDIDRSFYFLEMNTRLQVEHPVTEMITGIDLVREQINVAAGNPLTFQQDDIHLNGHAIECRIYAEDPENGFLPSPGTITRLRIPQGPGVRDDGGVYAGCDVSIHYDPMISKFVVHGRDRADAIKRMRRALREYEIGGIKNTLGFFRDLMSDQEFIEGRVDTGFIDRFQERRMLKDVNNEEIDRIAIIAAAEIHRVETSGTEKERSTPYRDSKWVSAGRLLQLRGR